MLCDKPSLDQLFFNKQKVSCLREDIPEDIIDSPLPSGLEQHFTQATWASVERKSTA